IKPTADAAMIMMRRLRFLAATPTRGTSIEERLGANPAGRTIVSSFGLRCGVTGELKRRDRSTKLAKSRCRAEQWKCGCSNDDCEEEYFADEIASRIVLKVLAANASKRRRSGLDASALILAKRHRLIVTVNHRKSPAVTSCYKDWLHWFFLGYSALVNAISVPSAETMSHCTLHQWLTFDWRIATPSL